MVVEAIFGNEKYGARSHEKTAQIAMLLSKAPIANNNYLINQEDPDVWCTKS